MKRAMIIGCCGAGKSTFARKLHERTALPLVHLDQVFWNPGWVEPPKDEWREKVEGLVSEPEWILDGNYGGTMDIRIQHADTIFFLDYPTWKCLWRITKRLILNYGKVRESMKEGCPERFDLKFFLYVAHWRITRRAGILAKLQQVADDKQIILLRNDREVRQFLEALN